MIMRFIDRAPVSGIRRTDDGYAVAEVPVARTGIQDYAGYEVGRPDLTTVSVYRPPETVFADDYLASMAHKPVTDDHPANAVTADNWDGIAKGWTGETIRKDEARGLVFVPMLMADAGLISKLEKGKREVSVGYTCELVWGDGIAPDGARYQAMQTNARVNHVAVVDRGRAGHTCRVGDNWQPIDDNKEPVVATKTITFDGLPVETTDAGEAVIRKLEGVRDALNGELKAAVADTATLTADKAKMEGEVAALKVALDEAKLTPDKLAKLVADRAALIDMAKKIAPDENFDNDDEMAIKKKAVAKKMGDKMPATDEAIAGAFDVLALTATDAAPAPTFDAFRATVASGVQNTVDTAKIAASIRDSRYN